MFIALTSLGFDFAVIFFIWFDARWVTDWKRRLAEFSLSADSSTWIDIVLLWVHSDCGIKLADNYDFRIIENPWLTVKMSTNHANSASPIGSVQSLESVESGDNFLTATDFILISQTRTLFNSVVPWWENEMIRYGRESESRGAEQERLSLSRAS